MAWTLVVTVGKTHHQAVLKRHAHYWQASAVRRNARLFASMCMTKVALPKQLQKCEPKMCHKVHKAYGTWVANPRHRFDSSTQRLQL